MIERLLNQETLRETLDELIEDTCPYFSEDIDYWYSDVFAQVREVTEHPMPDDLDFEMLSAFLSDMAAEAADIELSVEVDSSMLDITDLLESRCSDMDSVIEVHSLSLSDYALGVDGVWELVESAAVLLIEDDLSGVAQEWGAALAEVLEGLSFDAMDAAEAAAADGQ